VTTVEEKRKRRGNRYKEMTTGVQSKLEWLYKIEKGGGPKKRALREQKEKSITCEKEGGLQR